VPKLKASIAEKMNNPDVSEIQQIFLLETTDQEVPSTVP